MSNEREQCIGFCELYEMLEPIAQLLFEASGDYWTLYKRADDAHKEYLYRKVKECDAYRLQLKELWLSELYRQTGMERYTGERRLKDV